MNSEQAIDAVDDVRAKLSLWYDDSTELQDALHALQRASAAIGRIPEPGGMSEMSEAARDDLNQRARECVQDWRERGIL